MCKRKIANDIYVAGKSSEYLQGLIAHDQLAAVASDKLDSLYSTASNAAQTSSNESQVILTHEMVDQVQKDFDLDEQAGASRVIFDVHNHALIYDATGRPAQGHRTGSSASEG